jgi:hypothetical protein
MEPADAPRIEEDEMPTHRIVKQSLIEDTEGMYVIRDHDIKMGGTGDAPPARLLLDFAYGCAAFKWWGTNGGNSLGAMLQGTYENRYKDLPGQRDEGSTTDEDTDQPPLPEPSDEYKPSPAKKPRKIRHKSRT